jgi:predicted Zn-dependent protease
LLLASVRVDLKEYSRALPLLEGLRSASPDEAQVNFLLGRVHLARKQFALAVEFFEKSAARNPAPEVLRELGMSQLGLGQDRAALVNLEKAFAGDNRDTRAGMALAVTYARLGQSAKALTTADIVQKTDPDSPAMLSFAGQTRSLVGDLAGAREAYERALAKDPQFQQAIISLSWLDIDIGRFGTARVRLQALLKNKRDDAEALYQLGVLEDRAHQPAAAIAAWTRALESPHAEPRTGLALIDLYAAQRQNEQALAQAKRIAAKFPDSVPVQLALARRYFASGEPGMGRQMLAEATKLAGFDPVLQVQIGRMQLQYDNPAGAAYNANKALQSKPDDLQALVLAVDAEVRRGNAAGINAALKSLTARHPDDADTLMASASVALSRGQPAAAVAGYRAAMNKEPGTQTLTLLAQALVANREGAKARTLLEDWTARHPGDVQALKVLADVRLGAGDR